MSKPSQNRDCPYCRSTITDNQNKVICPECGIAHHAECWQAHQSCSVYGCGGWNVWNSLTESEPAVQPEQPPAPEVTSPEEKVRCIKCGVEISAGKMLCFNCLKNRPRYYLENCFGPTIIMLVGFVGIIVLIVRSII